MVLPRLVLSNLAVHRMRAALTISAIAVAISLVVAVTSGYASSRAVAVKFLGYYMGTSDLQITRSKGDPHGTFPESVADELRKDPEVAQALTRYGTGSIILNDKGKRVPGHEVDVTGVRRPQDKAVESLAMEPGQGGEWFDVARGEVAVIDQVLAQRMKVGVGGTIMLAGAEKPLKLKVVGIVHKPTIMAADQQTVYVPLETLQEFTGKVGRINRIMLTLKSGTDAEAFKVRWTPKIQQADPLLAMKSAGDMRKQMEQNLAMIRLLSLLAGMVSLVAATFIVFSALSMGVVERQRTLAMLRAIGAYRSQLVVLVMIEGVLLALLGALIGVPLGYFWVKALVIWKSDFFTAGVVMDWTGLAVGTIGAVMAAMAASLLPAFSAGRVDPLEAMSPHSKTPSTGLPWQNTIAGLILISIDPLIIFFGPTREIKFYGHFFPGIPSLMIGFFLLAPLFVWACEKVGSTPIARMLGLQPTLLRQQLTSGIWRAAGTGAALMVGLAILIVMQVVGHSMLSGWRLPNKFPDIFIFSNEALTPAQEKRLEQTPGIKPGELLPVAIGAAIVSGENLDIKGTNMIPQAAMFFGIDPDKAMRMIELEFRDANGNTAPAAEQAKLNQQADEDLKLGRHLIITDEYRRLLGKNRGDKIVLQTPMHGNVEYTIAGVVWSPGIDVMVSMFDMERQFDQRTATSIFGSLEDAKRDFGLEEVTLFAANLDYGVDKNKLIASMLEAAKAATSQPATGPATMRATTGAISAAPDDAGSSLFSGAKSLFGIKGTTQSTANSMDKAFAFSGLRQFLGMKGMQAGDVRQIKYQITQGFDRMLSMLSIVAYASMAVAALGVTNTIMASVRSRRWQFGILRSIGVTRSQLLRLVLAEAILLGLVGCALGLAAGFLMSLDARGLTTYTLGYKSEMVAPWGKIAIGAMIIIVTSLLASLAPAITVARVEPLELLQAGRASA
jgi:putative ABC transport system permease protein